MQSIFPWVIHHLYFIYGVCNTSVYKVRIKAGCCGAANALVLRCGGCCCIFMQHPKNYEGRLLQSNMSIELYVFNVKRTNVRVHYAFVYVWAI